MNSGIEPLGTKVLVYPLPVEEVSKGGIVIATEGTKGREEMAQVEGRLEGIGPMVTFDGLNVGDTVVFAKYGGLLVKGKDEKSYRLLDEEEIVAKRV